MCSREHLLLSAVLLTVLVDMSASLKCSSCYRSESETCDKEIDCPTGKVCYTTKERHYSREYTYETGCGYRDTHCAEHTSSHSSHSGLWGSLLGRRQGETKCCDTGDLCNTHLTFSTDVATTQPPYQLTSGIECQVCSGPTCGVMGDDPVIRCPDEFPLCMNIVLNEDSGSKMVTKRCAHRSECQRNGNSACTSFDPSEIYPTKMECIYCCETNGCNKDIVPRAETLLMG